MRVRRSQVMLAGLVLIGSSVALYARQQAAGSILPGQFVIINKANEPVPVTIPNLPAVDLSDRAVGVLTQIANRTQPTVVVRQNWEYRELLAAPGDDRTAALNAAGAQGWEATGFTVDAKGATTFVLKRPK